MSIDLVWVDRTVARIYHVSEERMGRLQISRPQGESRAGQSTFYVEIAACLSDSASLVILGPGGLGSAKTQFEEHLRKHDPKLAQNVIARETLVHPTDGSIAMLATKYLGRAGMCS